ncbi:MAG: hypothetical protein HYX35_00210 [Proteobacteria bacterium]|nr:hypothetical protein [Pseudomonadota bacterium]
MSKRHSKDLRKQLLSYASKGVLTFMMATSPVWGITCKIPYPERLAEEKAMSTAIRLVKDDLTSRIVPLETGVCQWTDSKTHTPMSVLHVKGNIPDDSYYQTLSFLYSLKAQSPLEVTHERWGALLEQALEGKLNYVPAPLVRDILVADGLEEAMLSWRGGRNSRDPNLKLLITQEQEKIGKWIPSEELIATTIQNKKEGTVYFYIPREKKDDEQEIRKRAINYLQEGYKRTQTPDARTEFKKYLETHEALQTRVKLFQSGCIQTPSSAMLLACRLFQKNVAIFERDDNNNENWTISGFIQGNLENPMANHAILQYREHFNPLCPVEDINARHNFALFALQTMENINDTQLADVGYYPENALHPRRLPQQTQQVIQKDLESHRTHLDYTNVSAEELEREIGHVINDHSTDPQTFDHTFHATPRSDSYSYGNIREETIQRHMDNLDRMDLQQLLRFKQDLIEGNEHVNLDKLLEREELLKLIANAEPKKREEVRQRHVEHLKWNNLEELQRLEQNLLGGNTDRYQLDEHEEVLKAIAIVAAKKREEATQHHREQVEWMYLQQLQLLKKALIENTADQELLDDRDELLKLIAIAEPEKIIQEYRHQLQWDNLKELQRLKQSLREGNTDRYQLNEHAHVLQVIDIIEREKLTETRTEALDHLDRQMLREVSEDYNDPRELLEQRTQTLGQALQEAENPFTFLRMTLQENQDTLTLLAVTRVLPFLVPDDNPKEFDAIKKILIERHAHVLGKIFKSDFKEFLSLKDDLDQASILEDKTEETPISLDAFATIDVFNLLKDALLEKSFQIDTVLDLFPELEKTVSELQFKQIKSLVIPHIVRDMHKYFSKQPQKVIEFRNELLEPTNTRFSVLQKEVLLAAIAIVEKKISLPVPFEVLEDWVPLGLVKTKPIEVQEGQILTVTCKFDEVTQPTVISFLNSKQNGYYEGGVTVQPGQRSITFSSVVPTDETQTCLVFRNPAFNGTDQMPLALKPNTINISAKSQTLLQHNDFLQEWVGLGLVKSHPMGIQPNQKLTVTCTFDQPATHATNIAFLNSAQNDYYEGGVTVQPGQRSVTFSSVVPDGETQTWLTVYNPGFNGQTPLPLGVQISKVLMDIEESTAEKRPLLEEWKETGILKTDSIRVQPDQRLTVRCIFDQPATHETTIAFLNSKQNGYYEGEVTVKPGQRSITLSSMVPDGEKKTWLTLRNPAFDGKTSLPLGVQIRNVFLDIEESTADKLPLLKEWEEIGILKTDSIEVLPNQRLTVRCIFDQPATQETTIAFLNSKQNGYYEGGVTVKPGQRSVTLSAIVPANEKKTWLTLRNPAFDGKTPLLLGVQISNVFLDVEEGQK